MPEYDVLRDVDGNPDRRKNNVTTTDPTGTDDETKGYRFGSRWLNTTSGEEFVCADPGTGVSDWVSTTAGGGTDDQTATEVPFTPVGSLSSTNAQAAIEEAATEAATALSGHAGDADPHTGYQKESEKGAASGYASLDAGTKVPVAQLGSGTPDGSKFLRDDQTYAVPPGTGGASFATPAIVLGTAAAAGAAATVIRSDSTIVAFDATAPVTQAYDDVAAAGAAAVAARRDHKHGMPSAGSGAPSTADYLVGTAQGGLSAEIVVGTTPGGELGGTWPSPTVDAVHGGSAHSQVLIASSVKGSAGASFQFASIPGTYNHLRVVLAGRCSAAVFDSYVRIRFNGDSSAIYDYKLFVDTGAATAGTLEQFAQTSAIVGQVPGASGPANIPGILTIDIPIYALTTFQKSVLFHSGEVSTSTGNLRLGTGVANWRNTAAITQIDLILGTGTNFVIGSAAYLYGIL